LIFVHGVGAELLPGAQRSRAIGDEAGGFARCGSRRLSWQAVARRGKSTCALRHLTSQGKSGSVRTYNPKPADITRQWHVIDANDVVLGRLASQSAKLLRGKHKPYYAPHLDTGDFVVIINAAKVVMTGNKAAQSTVYHHSGYPGGLRKTSYAAVLATRPERIVEKAIKGMIPHNTLGRQMLSKLKIYAGPTHPHQAQSPVPYELTQVAQ